MRWLPLLLLPLTVALAAEALPEKVPWKVDDPHGPTHTVSIDVREGTWMSLSAHGDRILFDLLGDLWSIPLEGGEARRITSGAAWDGEPVFSPDGSKIAFTSDRSGNEQIWIMDADGQNPRPLAKEGEARLTDAVWDPKGDWIYARRRTVDTRSIGVTEIWKYHLDGGKGIALTSKDNHPHAGELVVGPDFFWFSDRAGRFEYNDNPVAGLWSVIRMDRRNGEERPQIYGSGSAARPLLSPDGKQLAFVSRDRTKTLLEIMDLATSKRRVVADWLDEDQFEGFALHGIYPRMDWSQPERILLWSQGKLWKLNPADGSRSEIPFHVKGDWTLHDVARSPIPVPDQVQAKVLRWPVQAPDGTLALSAMGLLWTGSPEAGFSRLSPGTGYSPAWSPDGRSLAWTSWSDQSGGALHVTTFSKGKAGKDEVLPVQGQLLNPTWSADGQRLLVLRGPGGGSSEDLGNQPLYELLTLKRDKKGWGEARYVKAVANRGSGVRAPRLFLHQDRVYLLEDRSTEARAPEETLLVSYTLDGNDRREHILFDAAEEVVPSPDFRWVAYKSKHRAYLTAFPDAPVVAKIGDLPVQPLTETVGDWLSWTPDGRALSWMEGPTRSVLPVSHITVPEEGVVAEGVQRSELNLSLPRARPTGTIALTHARLITMEGTEILTDATLLIQQDRIAGVNLPVPPDAQVIDCTGKTVIPGLIDVHAHLHYTAGDVLPEQEWRYQTSLDFGVTTVHDPSAATDLVFTQAERVEAGLEVGPRVYSTGYVLYGALSNQGAETPNRESAHHHLQRLKLVGAHSAKIYQQGQRERRQWYAQACREEKMLCISEGGGDLWQNLTMYADGFQGVEHTMPGPGIYADVRAFVAGSHSPGSWGTANSPTLLVSYNSIMGENWFYQHMNPLDDARLLRHYPRRELDARAWRPFVMAQDGDWAFQQTARDVAAMQDAGALITLGAHGQLQGLGVHWELWAMAGATGPGGGGAMEPLEALRAATLDGARYLGLEDQLGSLRAGKLADLVVLEADPLVDIHNSARIAFTVKNGEIWR